MPKQITVSTLGGLGSGLCVVWTYLADLSLLQG